MTNTPTQSPKAPEITDLLLLAKSYAMDRRGKSIKEQDLFEALRSFRLNGTPEEIREVLGGRSAGDKPLADKDFKKRLELAKDAESKKLDQDALTLAQVIKKLGLLPASSLEAERARLLRRLAGFYKQKRASMPPAVRAIYDCEAALRAEVRDQDAAMREIAISLNRPRPETGPAGVYVLAGAPGSGKSLTARTMAKVLGVDYYAFDCSAVTFIHDEARIRGGSSIYGGARAGLVTEWVHEHPEGSVVELRNFQRMTPEAHGFLNSILDDGMLEDLYGFYPPGKNADNSAPIAPPEVNFRGVRLVIEVQGCEDLYDRPAMIAKLRETGGEAGLRRGLVDSLRGLKTRNRGEELTVFKPDLMTRLESAACFCLFTPLNSRTMDDIVREGLGEGLERAAKWLGLEAERPSEQVLGPAAKMLLWERGGRAAAGAFSASAAAERLFHPLYESLLRGGAPKTLRLAVDAGDVEALEKIEKELGEEPVQALYRGLKRVNWAPKVSLDGNALVLALAKPELVRAPPVEDFGEGRDQLVLEVPSARFADVAGLDRVKRRLKEEV